MKALLRLVMVVVGLALVVVVGAGVFVATLEPNDHKDWVIAKVKERTGRELALNGNIRLGLYPWIDLEVNDLTLANAPGFGATPFLHIDYLNVRVKTIPLLQEKYEVETVKLTGAQVNLARNKDGVTNWADLSRGGAQESRPLPLTAVILGGVDVQKAQLTWNDAASGAEYRVRDLTFTTGKLVFGEPIKLDLATAIEANKPALSSDLKLNGIVKYDLDAERYSVEPLALTGVLRSRQLPGGKTPISLNAALAADLDKDTASVTGLRFSALKTNVTGALQATKAGSGVPSVDSTLEIEGEDLALLFKVLEIEPLATQVAGLSERNFSLKTRLQADLERADANLSDMTAKLLGARIKGELKAANLRSETPSIKGTLNAIGPNLPLLMRVLGQLQGGSRSPLTRAGTAIADFPQRDFRIDTTFDADMKTGDIALPKFSASLLGTDIDAALTARNAQTKTPSVKGNLTATGADLPVLMVVAGKLQGTKDSALAVYGRKLGKVPDRKFAVKTEFDADFKGGNVKVPALTAQGLGLTIGGNLEASGMSGSGGNANGRLSLSGDQLKGLFTALDQPGLGDTLRKLQFDADIAGSGQKVALKPMALEALVVSEEIGNQPVKLALKADTLVDFDAQQLNLDALSVQGLGLDVKGNLQATKIMEAPAYTGKLHVAPFNLRKFMRQMKLKPPKTADKEVLHNVALQADVGGSATDFGARKFALQLDDTKIRGDISIQNFARPVVRFNIEGDQIEWDRYLPPEEEAGVGAPGEERGKTIAVRTQEAAARLPMEMLRALDVDGTLRMGRMRLAKLRFNQVTAKVTGKNGIIRIDPFSARSYDGTYENQIVSDFTGKTPKLTINLKMQGVQLEPVLTDYTGKPARARGVANFSAALVGLGATAPAIKRTLNGQMGFSIRDGAIKGYDLGKIMRQGQSLKESFSLNVSEHEETDLSEISGNPVATNGVITLDDLKGAGPGVRIGGKGVIADLTTSTVDYKLIATLVATSKGQGGKELQEGKLEGVPLECKFKGPLDNPKRDCDATKLLAAMGVKMLKGVLGLPGKLLPGGSTEAAPAAAGTAAPATQTAPAPKAAQQTQQVQPQQPTTTDKKKKKKAAADATQQPAPDQTQQKQDPVKDLTEGIKGLFKQDQ